MNNIAFSGQNRVKQMKSLSLRCVFYYFSREMGKRLNTWVGPKSPHTIEERGEEKVKSMERS